MELDRECEWVWWWWNQEQNSLLDGFGRKHALNLSELASLTGLRHGASPGMSGPRGGVEGKAGARERGKARMLARSLALLRWWGTMPRGGGVPASPHLTATVPLRLLGPVRLCPSEPRPCSPPWVCTFQVGSNSETDFDKRVVLGAISWRHVSAGSEFVGIWMRGFGFVGFFVGIVAMVGGKERESTH